MTSAYRGTKPRYQNWLKFSMFYFISLVLYFYTTKLIFHWKLFLCTTTGIVQENFLNLRATRPGLQKSVWPLGGSKEIQKCNNLELDTIGFCYPAFPLQPVSPTFFFFLLFHFQSQLIWLTAFWFSFLSFVQQPHHTFRKLFWVPLF